MNMIELYLEFETKWKEEEFGVCDCPSEIDENHPYQCEHMPTNEQFGPWLDEQELRFYNLLQLMTILR